MIINAILNDSHVIFDIGAALGPFVDNIRPTSSNTFDCI